MKKVANPMQRFQRRQYVEYNCNNCLKSGHCCKQTQLMDDQMDSEYVACIELPQNGIPSQCGKRVRKIHVV